MAHYATNRFNYIGQLGFLVLFFGVGAVLGGMLSFIPLLGKMNIADLKNASSAAFVENLLKPENATAIRWMQFISTLFIFFIPALLYAWLCHHKPFKHLGFSSNLTIGEVVLVILILIAALPAVSILQELTEMLPWPKSMLLQFKAAEEVYNKQVAVIARMDNMTDYIISVIVIAFLPALFEETLFRGGLQNLLSRWIKLPVLAIVITSIFFSAMHGSYLGFLSRFALGFVLGWVYYRTGNIWLNIIGHFINNALAVTSLYISTKPGQKVDPASMEDHFPLWIGLVSVAAVVGLLIFFDKIAKNHIDRPGQEVLIPGYNQTNNPFSSTSNEA